MVGIAYLYDAVTGDLLTTFSNPFPDGGDAFGGQWFGNSIAISGNLVAIGTIGGAHEVFVFDIWGTLLQTITSPAGPSQSSLFGWSLALNGSSLVIGDRRGATPGSVYFYQLTTVPEPSTLGLLGVGLFVLGLARRPKHMHGL